MLRSVLGSLTVYLNQCLRFDVSAGTQKALFAVDPQTLYLVIGVKDDLKSDALGLSLGQQQRLCIARVIAVQPEVILMDESTSALDPIATLRIEELIAELKKEYTIVIVTHNMQQAARVSNYTGLFWLGELVEVSETQAMFTRPKQELTEAYITGKMG